MIAQEAVSGEMDLLLAEIYPLPHFFDQVILAAIFIKPTAYIAKLGRCQHFRYM